ncbi:MAG: DUF364 domain-containing protein [Actinobacteria bacterium]|nr:DUF364 domain-containing protein [Actinomycetota bacterium]
MLIDRIVSLAGQSGGGRRLAEVIVGLGFTLARLDDGACGVAYTLRDELERGCDAFAEAGRMSGRELGEVLPWIGGSSVIASAIGLAAANALLLPPQEAFRADLLAYLDLQPGERVVTVGRFRPMEPQLTRMGVELEVVERGDPQTPLKGCDVALITATSIINNTIEELLEKITGVREAAILGPSTPYAPGAFEDSPVTILAGSVVSDPDRVRQVISEGGGTQTMGKALGRWMTRVS